ncbi:sulfotransferase [Congregibacter sp.]|uniref:sulfotransferase n=1 Tax=Congregibacter sp. TaxID=2744308 RepID=UPI003F6D909B
MLAFHGLCLALDYLLFPGFRRTTVCKPVFILGVPRSGTTYLHRELAVDKTFTTTASWELLFAPAVCQRTIIRRLAAIDLRLGSPLKKAITHVTGALGGSLESIHPVAADAAEEDYLALLPAAGCFFASLAFPASPRFAALGKLSSMPAKQRERLLDHYHALLQRHLYVHRGSQLLSKNAAYASWAPYLMERYPDALFVFCIRQPQEALSSQMSSIESALSVFGSYPAGASRAAGDRAFSDFYVSWISSLSGCLRGEGAKPLVIEQEWLRHHSNDALDLIYNRLGRKREALISHPTAQSSASAHRHEMHELQCDLVAFEKASAASYAKLVACAVQQRSGLSDEPSPTEKTDVDGF